MKIRVAPRDIDWTMFLVLFFMPLAASAASLNWTGAAGDGNWFTASNWSPTQVPTSADDALIDVNATVSVPTGSPSIAFNSLTLGDAAGTYSPTLRVSAAASTSGSVTINSGAILQQNTTAQLSFGGVNILFGGLLNHSANTSSQAAIVNLNVSGSFTVQAGGQILVDGLGYAGVASTTLPGSGPGGGGPGNNSGPYGSAGVGGSGGAHGGYGGGAYGGVGYDSAVNPTMLGSAGGATVTGAPGGSGGGVVLLQVSGTLTNNGLISANGVIGVNDGQGNGSGGGGGGAININAATLAGTGTIQANGGQGALYNASGGGGGRIALTVTSSDVSTLTLHANGNLISRSGAPGTNGGAGTIAVEEPGASSYNLTVGTATFAPQAATSVPGATLTFGSVSLSNSIVNFDNGSAVNVNSISVIGVSTVTASNMSVSSDVVIANGGLLTLGASSFSGGALNINGGTFQQFTAQQFAFSSVSIQAGGLLTHGANQSTRSYVVNLNVAGNLNVQPGGMILVDGLGYAGQQSSAGYGPGGGGAYVNNGSGPGDGVGGGHGGNGGGPNGGVAYDSILNPTDLGSGGGDEFYGVPGGSGGGAIILQVGGTLTDNGLISANGGPGFYSGQGTGSGGGGGGTVNISAANLTGTGTVQANGGAGSFPNGDGGGGGRIALTITSNDNSALTVVAAAGTGYRGAPNGGAGVIVTQEPSGASVLTIGSSSTIAGANTPLLGASPTFPPIALSNATIVFDPGSVATLSGLVVYGTSTVSGSTVCFSTGTSLVENSGALLTFGVASTSGAALIVRGGATFIQPNFNQFRFASVEVDSGGLMTHSPNGATLSSILNLRVTGNFSLASGASIVVDGLGAPGGSSGYPPFAGLGAGAGSPGSGGGHGGSGGGGPLNSVGGLSNDSIVAPMGIGSGGGGGNYAGGGAGGGAVVITVDGTFTANGLISANGISSYDDGAGGSGGTVNIAASALSGTATVNANGGGISRGSPGGGGGGGRIALYYGGSTSWTLSASGGTNVSYSANSGGAGSIVKNGQLTTTVQPSTTTSVIPLQEQLTSAQTLSATLSAQSLDFAGATSTGTTTGTFSAAVMRVVTIQNGALANDGFFNGTWTLAFTSSSYLTGTWAGTAFFSASPREIVLNGVLEGGIRGVLTGALIETAPGSGIFNNLSATCNSIQIGTDLGSTPLYLSGVAPTQSPVQYPGTSINFLQKTLTGQSTGYYSGPLATTYTLATINNPGGPFNGQGFLLPSYSSRLGNGTGWAYASMPEGQSVVFEGVFNAPLGALLEGNLIPNGTQPTFFSLENPNAGGPVLPQLSLSLSGPNTVDNGLTYTFAATVTNSGYATASGVTLVARYPDFMSFVSASGNFLKYTVANFAIGSTYYSTPVLRWDIPSVPPNSAVTFQYLAMNVGGAPAHASLGGGIQIMTTAWANQIFAHYPVNQISAFYPAGAAP